MIHTAGARAARPQAGRGQPTVPWRKPGTVSRLADPNEFNARMTAINPAAPGAHEQALEARLVELETRLSFQEHTIGELSDALAEARMEGARNANVLRALMEDLGKMRNALNSTDPASEPPPPHY